MGKLANIGFESVGKVEEGELTAFVSTEISGARVDLTPREKQEVAAVITKAADTIVKILTGKEPEARPTLKG